MLISKKDLLAQTGISYGQLYRWKREGLIPEEWFIKQPSFTGQETFFPKTAVLNRIDTIQRLKDQYSLEELARILSPEVSERNFTTEDLHIIEELSSELIPAFCRGFDKRSFAFVEVLMLVALSQCSRDYAISAEQIESLCRGLREHLKDLKQTDYLFVLLDKDGDYLVALYQAQAQVFLDSRLQQVCEIRLDEISTKLKVKYRKRFNLQLDQVDGGTVELDQEGVPV
ncbi:MAG: DUF4004 family protein [Christensenellales bacterium]|jgi:DNA-binding transcriptional MerR regulator